MLRGAFKIKMLCLSGEKLLGVWVGRGCPAIRKAPCLCGCLGLDRGVLTAWGMAQKWGTTLSAIPPRKLGTGGSYDCF